MTWVKKKWNISPANIRNTRRLHDIGFNGQVCRIVFIARTKTKMTITTIILAAECG